MVESPIVKNFAAALTEALSELDSAFQDEIAKRDTQITTLDSALAVRNTEIANLRATIIELGLQINKEQRLNLDCLEKIKTLEAEIARLKSLLATDPQRPPIQVAPDITVTLDGIGTFRPPLNGERQGSETRYAGNLNSDVRVICDIKDDGQIAIAIERCWADLTFIAPVLQTNLSARVGAQQQYSAPLRLHHHTRPRLIINSSPPPQPHLSALIRANLVPNYSQAVKPAELELAKIDEGRHPWPRMSPAAMDYDRISEEYGQVINSWVGGAGPLLNEASHLMPVQLAYLLTQDTRAWTEVLRLANSSGNYAVHYKARDDRGGHWPLPSETADLPFLNQTGPVTLKNASGTNLPIPDVAHQHSLTYVAYLLTGERYYREELEAWCGYNLLTRPKDEHRLNGIIHSGQERATAWALRALLHIAQACAHGPEYLAAGFRYSDQLNANLKWLNSTFVNPLSSHHRATGVLSVNPFRPSPFLAHVTLEPKPPFFSTWNYHVLASVLNECVRSGFAEAVPIRNHVLRVIEGVWKHSRSRFDIAWGQHVLPADNWPAIISATFAGRATLPSGFAFPITPDYVAWARSALVAAADAGQFWAVEALAVTDKEAAAWKGGIPLAWQISPSV